MCSKISVGNKVGIKNQNLTEL